MTTRAAGETNGRHDPYRRARVRHPLLKGEAPFTPDFQRGFERVHVAAFGAVALGNLQRVQEVTDLCECQAPASADQSSLHCIFSGVLSAALTSGRLKSTEMGFAGRTSAAYGPGHASFATRTEFSMLAASF
jgi:hypothetical protein